MIRMIAQSENGNWETHFGNTTLLITKAKERYRVLIHTLTCNGGMGFSTKRKHLSDIIEQTNKYLKRLDGSRIILIVGNGQPIQDQSIAD